MAANDEWQVSSHGPIERLNDNLWRVQGALPGMSLMRTMTIAKMANEDLVLHSAIALAPAELSQLETLGRVAALVVPNGIHRLDAPRYKRRYPGARVYCPEAERKKVSEVVVVDGSYEDFPVDERVSLRVLAGTGGREGVMLVRGPDGTSVVLNDIVMNMDRKRDVLGYLFTTLLGSAPGPRVSRLSKLTFVKDKRALRAELEQLANLPDLARLIVSHEKVSPTPSAAREDLLKAASYL